MLLSANKRLILNTASQYCRTILNILMSFYSVNLILKYLGFADYGIYTLIVGVVSMLSFINNSLVITTQRFLSFYHGVGEDLKLKMIFKNSLFIHIVLGFFIFGCIEFVGLFLFDGFLNIEEDRMEAAKIVFHIVATILCITFITAPFRALYIARENIVYVSVVDVLDGLMKVIFALLLSVISFDRLIAYVVGLLIVALFNLFAYSVFALIKYDECSIDLRVKLDKNYIFELSKFATWTLYSTMCIVGRTQGIAILLNRFFGTIINAAYGLALQVSSAINFVSTSFLNAINPQITKAEGGGDREKMLHLAFKACKFSFLILAMVVIPVIFEMEKLLDLWLDKVPEYAVLFCRVVLIGTLVDQLTVGLGSANQAIGSIKKYSLVVNTTKLLTLLFLWVCIKLGVAIEIAIWNYAIFEFICAMIRIPFLKITAGMSVKGYFRDVFIRVLLPIVAIILTCFFVVKLIDSEYRVIFTFLIGNFVFILFTFCFAFSQAEKKYLYNLFVIVINKIMKK